MNENRYFVHMNIETRKLHLFEAILSLNNEAIIDKLASVLEEEKLSPETQNIMESRALKAEEDIKEGRVYTLEQAETRLNARLGL